MQTYESTLWNYRHACACLAAMEEAVDIARARCSNARNTYVANARPFSSAQLKKEYLDSKEEYVQAKANYCYEKEQLIEDTRKVENEHLSPIWPPPLQTVLDDYTTVWKHFSCLLPTCVAPKSYDELSEAMLIYNGYKIGGSAGAVLHTIRRELQAHSVDVNAINPCAEAVGLRQRTHAAPGSP